NLSQQRIRSNVSRVHVDRGVPTNRSATAVIDQKVRVARSGEIASESEADGRAPDDAPADIKDVSEESASSGKAGRAHVNPGIHSDHSKIGVIDREVRVAAGSEIGESAAHVKSEIGARINRSVVAVVDQ